MLYQDDLDNKGEVMKRLPLRIQIAEEVLELAKENCDLFVANVCRKILSDYRLGRKSDKELFQVVYSFKG